MHIYWHRLLLTIVLVVIKNHKNLHSVMMFLFFNRGMYTFIMITVSSLLPLLRISLRTEKLASKVTLNCLAEVYHGSQRRVVFLMPRESQLRDSVFQTNKDG